MISASRGLSVQRRQFNRLFARNVDYLLHECIHIFVGSDWHDYTASFRKDTINRILFFDAKALAN